MTPATLRRTTFTTNGGNAVVGMAQKCSCSWIIKRCYRNATDGGGLQRSPVPPVQRVVRRSLLVPDRKAAGQSAHVEHERLPPAWRRARRRASCQPGWAAHPGSRCLACRTLPVSADSLRSRLRQIQPAIDSPAVKLNTERMLPVMLACPKAQSDVISPPRLHFRPQFEAIAIARRWAAFRSLHAVPLTGCQRRRLT